MKIHAPQIAFRGTRTYLHSTDLYEEILAGSAFTGLGKPDGPLTMKMRRTLVLQPELCYLEPDEDVDVAAAPTEFVVTVAGRGVRGIVRETIGAVTRRKGYDERPIWEVARLWGQTVAARATTGATPIEVVTALGVLLHRTLYPPSPNTRWMLGRLDLARPLAGADIPSIEITLRQQIAGRMTRSTIVVAGGALGTMEFILAPW
jgi:hypothetical protein